MRNHFHHQLKTGVAGLLLSLSLSQAYAATVTDDFDVRITIQNTCTISTTVSDLDFGTAQLLTANTDNQTSFAVTCTNGLPYTMGLSAGAQPSSPGVTTTRRMTGAGQFVSYDLFQDSGRTTHWGNAGADLKSANGTGAAQPYDVFGRVPAQTTPAAGSYLDTVRLTVTY